jgi:hypothetical protein
MLVHNEHLLLNVHGMNIKDFFLKSNVGESCQKSVEIIQGSSKLAKINTRFTWRSQYGLTYVAEHCTSELTVVFPWQHLEYSPLFSLHRLFKNNGSDDSLLLTENTRASHNIKWDIRILPVLLASMEYRRDAYRVLGGKTWGKNFIFEFPCIISLYYAKNQRDATLAVLLISNCKITLHVSDASRVHHQEY